MYYRLYDLTCGRYMATGYNAYGKEELLHEIIEYMNNDVDCEDDINILENSSVEELCAIIELDIEESEIPFEEQNY